MSTDEEVEAALDEGDEPSSDGSTSSEAQRHWLTNDVGFLWILACYMTVWASVHLSPLRVVAQPSVPWLVDATAGLCVAAALTWGFGVDALEKYTSLKGDA